MAARLLFISDLHLQDARPDITASLLQFLITHTGRCDALYILGDLFEVWLGDDAQDNLAQRVAAALRAFHDNGAVIYLMHGNRDFLIGSQFAELCGGHLLEDPQSIDTPVGPVLLSHGDSLCIDDHDYQQFRRQVRDPDWQRQFLALPISERRALAGQARQQSKQATANKAADIMDVNQGAVERLLRERGHTRFIHGHTHRPARHEISLDPPLAGATSAWRLVLGDWDRQGWYGEITAAGVTLERFPLQRV